MIKIETAKTVANLIVARSVGFTVASIIQSNTPVETKIQKIEVQIGAHVLGQMVASSTSTYVNKQVETVYALCARIKPMMTTTK